ncbi:FxLYD domain-containing protein [Rossellomorea sp. AcN35-11]|nr:FxLYD domain-containing protein [Rossellomorea aquimaris]NMH68065.1 hypothetical protein [Bacillus sp. RO3]WJV29901.1 FxLYD domain-containing protein [Rossellomorea sp. AcN35-11]
MKKLGKYVVIMIAAFLMVSIVGCSQEAATDKKEEKSIDTAFIHDLEKALEKRWKYIDDVDNGKKVVEDDSEYMEELLSFEKELYDYLDKDFNDPKLKAIATDYLDGLKAQEESTKYYNVDFIKYDELWSKGYNSRSTSLLKLVEEYGLDLNEEQFKDLKTNAQIVKKENKITENIEEMVRTINFTEVKTEYDWTTYNTTLENTSGADLESFSIDINFFDAEGVIIGTAYAYHDNTWKAGQKVLFEFETDIQEFEKMEWEADYYIAESE